MGKRWGVLLLLGLACSLVAEKQEVQHMVDEQGKEEQTLVDFIPPSPYPVTIKRLAPNRGGAMVLLSNGSEWFASSMEVKEGGEFLWQVGNQVAINRHWYRGFVLANQSVFSEDRKVAVALQMDHVDTLPTIGAISKEASTIVLSDGSHWKMDWWARLWAKTWEEGDRIVAAPTEALFGWGEFILINTSRDQQYIRVEWVEVD